MEWHSPAWLTQLGSIMLKLLPGGVLTVWCLWGISWRKAWPVLAAGGWAPLTLIGLMAAFVWSRVWPSTMIVFGVFPVPNLLWQLGSVGLLIGTALFCGWLQTLCGWYPPEIDFDPPAHEHDHHHEHASAH